MKLPEGRELNVVVESRAELSSLGMSLQVEAKEGDDSGHWFLNATTTVLFSLFATQEPKSWRRHEVNA